MERLALVGRLKNDSLERARELIRAGPAFEAKERGFTRLFILLSATEVIFVFEGHQVEWPVFGLQDTPWDWAVAERREEWRELFDGPIRIAREAYSWDEESDSGVIGPALAPENFEVQLNTAPRQAEMPANRLALLFDFDGRLISTGGAGAALWRPAFGELYGIPAEIGKAHRGRDDGSRGRPAHLHR